MKKIKINLKNMGIALGFTGFGVLIERYLPDTVTLNTNIAVFISFVILAMLLIALNAVINQNKN